MYGIFNGKTLTRFKHAKDLRTLAIIFMKVKLRESDLEPIVSKENMKAYLETWMEWSQDGETPFENLEEAVDQAHSTLVYSNIHFMNCDTKCQISEGDREIVGDKIMSLLMRGIKE